MSQTIRIPGTLFQRLEQHAKGFDTPAGVIERLLNYYESQDSVQSTKSLEIDHDLSDSLDIVLSPPDMKNFKKLLMNSKKAYVRLHKTDGTIINKEWNAAKFTEYSDVMGNLRSGYLRGWRKRGICKAEISIEKFDV